MTDSKIRKLVLSALMAALCTIMTMVIQVPSPMQGYVNLGDCAVLISAWMLGPLYGGAAAGIGSALADLLSGYAHYVPGTFAIKFLMAAAAALILRAMTKKAPSAMLAGHHGPGLFRLCQPVAGQGAGCRRLHPRQHRPGRVRTGGRHGGLHRPQPQQSRGQSLTPPHTQIRKLPPDEKTSGGNFLCPFVVRFGLLLQPPDHLVHAL